MCRTSVLPQVRLLNFERPSDALDFRPPPAPRRPGDNAGSSAAEQGAGGSRTSGSDSGEKTSYSERVKEVLRLRSDFQREAIEALEL